MTTQNMSKEEEPTENQNMSKEEQFVEDQNMSKKIVSYGVKANLKMRITEQGQSVGEESENSTEAN